MPIWSAVSTGKVVGKYGLKSLQRGLVGHHDFAGGEIEGVQVVVERVGGAVVFLAQAVHQRELAGDFEIVLGVEGPVAEAIVLRGERLQASNRGGEAEQEIGVGVAGEFAGEGEAAEDLDSGGIRHVAIDEEVDFPGRTSWCGGRASSSGCRRTARGRR